MTRLDDKGVLTMNRPKVLNALSISMIRKMTAQIKKWEEESSVSMIIIKGTGGKSFCCGGDLREVTDAGRTLSSLSVQYFFEEYTLDYLTEAVRVPWIALIDGITMGAGVGLSVHGRYRVATERTLFAMPETAIGLFPDVGGGHFLPRLPGKLGMYLALTGFRLKGRDVQRIGIATHFVDSSQLANLEQDLLSLRSAKPSDIDNVLQSYHDKCTIDRETPFVLEPHIDKINALFVGKTLEEIFDNLRRDDSDWSRAQLNILGKMSPTSMKVTFRQMVEGAHLTLAQDLKMEYRLSQRFIRDKDLYEGVRAIVIDKDQNPRWEPARIEDVTDEKVNWYFSPLDYQELELPQ
jgi:3-hydroxyisobutyryl-CoA hydrolase